MNSKSLPQAFTASFCLADKKWASLDILAWCFCKLHRGIAYDEQYEGCMYLEFCALCQETEDLRQSHIYPKGILSETSRSKVQDIRNKTSAEIRSEQQAYGEIKDATGTLRAINDADMQLLCDGCEKR